MSTQPPQQDLVQRLNLLSRKQLQCLAKHYNVKANIKSSDIVDELIAAAEYGTRQSLLSLLENKPEWVASGSDMFGKENVRTQLNTDEKAADASRFHDDGIGMRMQSPQPWFLITAYVRLHISVLQAYQAHMPAALVVTTQLVPFDAS